MSAPLPPPPAYTAVNPVAVIPAGPVPAPVVDAGARFQALCAQYEISTEYAQKLRLLSDVEVVVIADDSGSMSSLVATGADPFGPMRSRWDELKSALGQIVDIALLFDQNGLDIYFLNRTETDGGGRVRPRVLRNCTQHAVLEAAFAEPPAGYTPLTRTLETVLEDKRAVVQEKRLLLLICTDGQPTNESGAVDVKSFRQVLSNRQPIDRIFVTIMACSDEPSAIGYLSRLDREIPNLDVVDDYKSERKEVVARYPNCKYTIGDHIVKTLIGSLDPAQDRLDEGKGNCCVVL